MPRESLNLTPRVPDVESGRPWAVWVLRAVVAALLLVGAWWWSTRPNWSGNSCDVGRHEFCDGYGVEGHVPAILWTITVVATLAVSLLGVLTGPRDLRQRVVWALMLGFSVFVANRHNFVWAAVVTGVAMWGIASTTDLMRRPAR